MVGSQVLSVLLCGRGGLRTSYPGTECRSYSVVDDAYSNKEFGFADFFQTSYYLMMLIPILMECRSYMLFILVRLYAIWVLHHC